jgi:hypothetical protein
MIREIGPSQADTLLVKSAPGALYPSLHHPNSKKGLENESITYQGRLQTWARG